ncbi:MFS transporter [Pseudomonas sp. CC120222-01a]|uniref:MFS transporter n=1 Tax=Pseudomonas sp. CC120222-01a TaxID=1378075 RepID=UPI000D95BDA9|nr:MFS transporter [Pseudomonas sp. CC120222-01a]PVZ36867.1 MFS transporter [Pseudomonas sp. CC120222-01a]
MQLDLSTSGMSGQVPITSTDWGVRTWVLLLLVSGALFLDAADLSMVSVALPSMGSELGLSTASLQWVVNGYILGYGGFLLLGGRASDLLGRRSVFLVAVAAFGVASVASAMLDDIVGIVVLRFIKGVAAGFTVPAGMSIIATSFAQGPARSKALTIYAIMGTLGFGMGLVLGGIFTEIGWRVTLFAPGPISLLFFFAGLKLIPSAQRQRLSLKQFDLLGAISLTGGLLLLVYTLVEASETGWFAAHTLIMGGVSLVLLVSFVLIEKRHPYPMIRLGILNDPSLVHANLAAVLLIGSFMAYQFVMTLYLSESLGWSPMMIALAFLPSSAPVPLLAKPLAKIFSSLGTTVSICMGMSLLAIGFLLLLRIEPGMPYWSFMLPTVLCVLVGFALCFGAINIQGTQGVAESEQGLASGLVNTSLQIGGALSLAIAAALLGNIDFSAVRGHLLPNMHLVAITITIIASIGAISCLPIIMRNKR